MNLNTLVRHGVIGPDANREMVEYVAARLADPDEIRRSRQFPYQYPGVRMGIPVRSERNTTLPLEPVLAG
jgi:hypothetical protein